MYEQFVGKKAKIGWNEGSKFFLLKDAKVLYWHTETKMLEVQDTTNDEVLFLHESVIRKIKILENDLEDGW